MLVKNNVNRTSAIDNWRRLMLTTDTGHDPGTLPIPTPPSASSPFSLLSNPPYLTRIGCIRTLSQTWDLSKKSTPPDFQAKKITLLISLNFNSFGDKNTKKRVKMEKFTPLAKILHCRRHWRHWQISPLARKCCGGQAKDLVNTPELQLGWSFQGYHTWP